MAFEVVLHKKAVKELNRLDSKIKPRIELALKGMRSDPFYGDVRPLEGIGRLFRKRIGDYRRVFTLDIEKNTVLILKIAKRGTVYKGV